MPEVLDSYKSALRVLEEKTVEESGFTESALARLKSFVNAIELVKTGAVKRVDVDDQTSVYRVANIVRIDMKD